jgi:hypothetical protein
MRIQSLIERPASPPFKPYVGTLVKLDGKEYLFKPSDADPRHVCEVDNEQHVKILLAIKEGYRDADAPPENPSVAVSLSGDGDDEGGFASVSETELDIDGELVELKKQSRDGLLTIMRKLNIEPMAGYQDKAKLITHILTTLESRIPG